MADKHAGGRPTKYKTEYVELAYNYSLLGATDKELSRLFDVSEDTINEWKKIHPEFSESLKRGKDEADAKVAQKLYHRAIGYEHIETITAAYQGQITDKLDVIKHYAPDPTAAIFWLKNRQPDKWRDKQELDLGNKDNKPFEVRNMSDAELEAALEQEIQKRGYVKPNKTE